MRRSFLFLQGPCTPFFSRLARRLASEGHAIHRIQFCTGDVLYWRMGKASWFRGRPDDLNDFLVDRYRRYSITDQILFGDRRPMHRLAVAHAKACGVRTHVFEEGYFRPYWVTLEREGVNGHSLLPRDPNWFWHTGGKLDDPVPVAFHCAFFWRAFHDVAYHLAGMANPLLFPRYRTHANVIAPVEYVGYVRRFVRLRLIRQRDQERVHKIASARIPYFVLPLQLNTDAQIRDHSRFTHMGEVIEHVLESFARHAPAEARIVIKNHPLDAGLMNYARIIRECVRRFDLSGRVEYLEEGDLVTLLSYASGVVTVNSTVGIVALEQGIPVLTLSDPIYNVLGLTNQVLLDEFWCDPIPPNRELFIRFKRCVVHATQINGSFYCAEGIVLAVENSVPVLTAYRSPLETLL